MREFTPRPYQEMIIDHIVNNKRCAIWAGMGLGKTSAALTSIEILKTIGEIDDNPILVLAPKRVALSTWPEEAYKWNHLKNISVMPIVGAKKERLAALRYNAHVYTCNYDNLEWLVDYFGTAWPFKTVISDESTRLKSFRLRQGGKRAAALSKVTHTRVERFIQLTGTPAPNGLKDLWGQLWFLDMGKRLGRSYSAFSQRWFKTSYDGYDIEPLPSAQTEIQDLLRDICLTIDAKDWFDIKDPIINNVYVELPVSVRNLYRKLENETFVKLQEYNIDAVNAAVLTLKCLQFASGAVYIDDQKNWKEVHDVKIQALEEIVNEANGTPVLVAYHFKSDLQRLTKAFPKGRVLDASPETIKDWNAGRIPILFAHPQSAGHGLNLQDGGNILVYFGHWWALEERLQILERIGPTRQIQSGHNRPVFIYNIIAKNTVDEDVIERISTKGEVQDILLNAMKRRGNG